MRYIKIPVEVDAFQYFDDMGNYTYQIPVWFNQAIIDEVVFVEDGITYIKSREGRLILSDGDWVIRGESKEYGYHLWINKPDYFETAYKPVYKRVKDGTN